MQEFINTFSKGLDKDTSKAKFSNEKYYDALNVEVVTNNGLSTLAITNTKGTRLEFSIPNIPSQSYEDSSEQGQIIVPAQNNLQIIDFTSYDNHVIIFTCGMGGYGQIWKVSYDEITDTPIGIVAGSLTIANHLIYNRYLNFQLTNRIKAFVRKESSVFIRLYWNDGGLNPLRSLNLARPNAEILETRVRTINIQPQVNFELPILNEIIAGNLPNCRIGYFYRLVSKDGSLTTFSPISNLIDLNNGNENGMYQFYPDNGQDFKNDAAENDAEKRRLDFSSEKGLIINFPQIDKDYDYIQVGYVQYQIKDQPEIFLFPPEPLKLVGVSKECLFIHSGNEKTEKPLSIEEFNALNNTFDTVKDFTAKQNILYVSNIKNTQYDVDFDARAYRYKSNSTTYVSFPVAEDADAVNPFNDENPDTNPNWLTDDQYKFKADGTTLGGEGPNVSYTFTVNEHIVDKAPEFPLLDASSMPFTLSDKQNAAPFNIIEENPIASESFNITNQTYGNLNKSFSDLKSPYKSGLFEGYARGEVYRFGLVFVNSKGQKSFVKWIGDIKFPFFHDNGYELDRYDEANNIYYIRTLGIKFTVSNIPLSILSDFSHIEIVRVERQDEDRTKLGTGITGGFVENVHQPFTFGDFEDFITALVEELLQAVLGASTGLWAWIAGDKVYKQLSETIVDTVTNGLGVNTDNFNNMSFEDFLLMMNNGIGQLGGKTTSGLTSLFTGKIGDSLINWLSDKLKDVFKNQKVAGIDDIVYSIDNATIYGGTYLDKGVASGKDFAYIISPITQFDKYKFRTGDYLVPVASYEYNADTERLPKFVSVYHRDVESGIFQRVHSTAKQKKWYRPIYYDIDDISRLEIEVDNILDVGEILVPNGVKDLPNATFVNAYLGRIERLQNDGEYLAGVEKLSVRTKVLGIGDKKHFVKVSDDFPGLIDPANEYVIFDQQDGKDSDETWKGLLYSDYSYTGVATPIPNNGTMALTAPNIVDASGNFLVSYERYLTEQYGGNSYNARSFNTYITTAVIPKSAISGNQISNVTVYRGDTYVGLYDSVNYAYYLEQIPGYDPSSKTKKASGELFPAEAPFNFNVREGLHFNISANTDDLDQTERRVKRRLKRAKRKSKRSGLDFNEVAERIIPKRFLYDSHIYDEIYDQDNIVQISVPSPVIDIFTDTNTNRIFRSKSKLDGELIDSWKLFKPGDYIDVEGIYGEITSIHSHKDRLFFYQNNAFGIITTNEREMAVTSSGSTAIASSKPLSRYDYISTETGCSHLFGVVNTDGGIYHFDINKKKLFQYILGNSLKPLSDVEGLSSEFRNRLSLGYINNLDQTVNTIPAGLHGIYDNSRNKLYYTFLNYTQGQEGIIRNDFTVSYNLLQQAFDSFHSFTPGIYLSTTKRLFSVDPANKGRTYYHDKFNYNSYYGVLSPSRLTIVVNGNPDSTKTFNNHLLFTEVTDSNGDNIVNETISQINCTTDYQETGTVNLTIGTNIRRMERKWHLQIPRDTNTPAYTTLRPRLVDTNMFSTLIYNNPNNRKIILHDIYTYYLESIT